MKSKVSLILWIGVTLTFSGMLIDSLVGELASTFEIASPLWFDYIFFANLFSSVGNIIATCACFFLVLHQKRRP
jgi:hypothetical protein